MKYYTDKEIRLLKKNPYTLSVRKSGIRFTLDFKKFVMQEVKAGNTSVNIFRKAGYDPEVVGVTRIYTFVKNLKKEAVSPQGLKPASAYRKVKVISEKQLKKERDAATIKKLQNELFILQQKLEFLRKLYAISYDSSMNKK